VVVRQELLRLERSGVELERGAAQELRNEVERLTEELEEARVEVTCHEAILKDWRNGAAKEPCDLQRALRLANEPCGLQKGPAKVTY
jgi:hypothetical protein